MERKYFGKFQAIVRDIHDPWMVGRIRAEVPYPLGIGEENWSVWALPCLPPGHFEVPKEGDGVWIEFVNGDLNQPVWTGVWYSGRGTDPAYPTTAPFQAPHPKLTDFDGNPADPDEEHAKHPLDDEEHRFSHDHKTTFYTPHRRTWMSATGHHVEWNDHPGKDGYVKLADRFGRVLMMTARGITRLRSLFVPASSSAWKNLDGEYADAAHELVFADYLNDDPNQEPGQYILLKDMAGAFLKLTSTPGYENITLADFWNQYIKVNSVKDQEFIEVADKALQKIRLHAVPGEEYVELLDKAGQAVRLDVATGTVTVRDATGNFVELKDGQVTVTSNGNVTVNVPSSSNVHIGGEGGQELATKTFVQQYFNTHTHVSGAPGSPTSPPMQPAPLAPGQDITKKQKSE